VWPVLIEEAIHPISNIRRDIFKTSMTHPVLCCILSQGEVLDPGFLDTVIQLKEDAETCSSKKGMGRFGKNLKVGNRCRVRNAIRGQVFFH